MNEIMKVGEAIQWEQAEKFTNSEESKNKDKVTMCFFGECGTGKSTDLSLIARMYKIKHKDACEGEFAVFASG